MDYSEKDLNMNCLKEIIGISIQVFQFDFYEEVMWI